MPREWPAPDDRRCTREKSDGSGRCPMYAQHDSPDQLCNAHDGTLQRSMERHFERERVTTKLPAKVAPEVAERELREHYAEVDELAALDPDDTPLGIKLLRAINDPTESKYVKEVAQWKLDQLRAGTVETPEPLSSGPEVSPDEVQARIRDGWPVALATSRSTDYRQVLGIPDPHGEPARRRRPKVRLFGPMDPRR